MRFYFYLALMCGLFSLLATSITGAAVYCYKSHGSLRRLSRNHALATVGLILLDLTLLASLPYANISHGPILVPLVAWWAARLLVFLGWLISTRRYHAIENENDFRRGIRPFSRMFASLNLILVAVMVYGFIFEPFNLGVTYVELSTNHQLPQPSLRIMQISDIHVERLTRREHALLDQVAAVQPDLIVLTGDYLNISFLNDPVTSEQTRWLLSQLQAPMGVYAINGSVDRPETMQQLFTGLDITVLDNETVRPGNSNLYLVGITRSWHSKESQTLEDLAAQTPPEAYTLLLHHTPDLIKIAAAADIDLYLAGHTHGGQIRLPIYGALITFSAFGKQYEMGQYTEENTTLYVTRGLGMEGSIAPRARFLCPPELVVIDLEMESSP